MTRGGAAAARLMAGAAFGVLLMASQMARADTPKSRVDLALQPMHGPSGHLMDLAQQALKRQQFTVAEIYLKQAVKAAPKDATAHAALGYTEFRLGDFPGAERQMRLARQDGAPTAKVLPALYEIMLSRHEDAKLLEEFPAPGLQDRSALANATLIARARAFEQQGDLTAAGAALDRALAIGRTTTALLVRAQLARRQGEDGLALKLARDALAQSPSNTQALILQVRILQASGEAGAALKLLNPFLTAHPKDVVARLARAGVYLEQHATAQAAQDIAAARKLASTAPVVRYYEALLRQTQNQPAKAWQIAQNLPRNFVLSKPEIVTSVSDMALAAGRREVGTGFLSAYLQQDPQNAAVRLQLAAQYLALKDPERALETLARLRAQHDPRAYLLMSEAYGAEHKPDLARQYMEEGTKAGLAALKAGPQTRQGQAGLKAFRELAQSNPGNPNIVGPLILALLRQGAFDEARTRAESLSKVDAQSPLGPLFEGLVAMRMRDSQKAVQAYSAALARKPDFLPALYDRGLAEAQAGKYPAAQADLEKVLRRAPKDSLAALALAQVDLSAGQPQTARAVLEQAARNDPKNVAPVLGLAHFELAQGHRLSARKVLEQFLQRSPDDVQALLALGRVQVASGQLRRAAATFRAVQKKAPKSVAAGAELAGVLTQLGDVAGAIGQYQAVLKLAPDNPLVLNNLAWLEKTQDAKAAQAYGLEAVRLAPNAPPVLDTLAEIDLQLGQNAQAMSLLTRAHQVAPNDPDIAYHLAVALKRNGKAQQARQMLETALASKAPFAARSKAQALAAQMQ